MTHKLVIRATISSPFMVYNNLFLIQLVRHYYYDADDEMEL